MSAVDALAYTSPQAKRRRKDAPGAEPVLPAADAPPPNSPQQENPQDQQQQVGAGEQEEALTCFFSNTPDVHAILNVSTYLFNTPTGGHGTYHAGSYQNEGASASGVCRRGREATGIKEGL